MNLVNVRVNDNISKMDLRETDLIRIVNECKDKKCCCLSSIDWSVGDQNIYS